MEKQLGTIFPHFNLMVTTWSKKCFSLPKWKLLEESDQRLLLRNLSNQAKKLPENSSYLMLPAFAHQPLTYLENADVLAGQVFEFKESILATAKDVLRRLVMVQRDKSAVLVGVHARRQDYREQLWTKNKGYLPSKRYFLDSFDHIRKAIHPKKAVFVVASDDIKWTRRMFQRTPNVFHFMNFYPKGLPDAIKPGIDMCLLSLCDHSILRNDSCKSEA